MQHVISLLTLVFFLVFCTTALAKDGLVVRFIITETSNIKLSVSDHTISNTSYGQTVLISFNEQHSFNLPNHVLVVGNATENNKEITLSVTLKDIIDDKPYYIGADSVNLTVGETHKMEFTASDVLYTVAADTSYGKLPK